MKAVERLSANRLRVLKALVAGGRVEQRRVYPFPSSCHLIVPGSDKSPPKVSDVVMDDLTTRKLITPAVPVRLTHARAADDIDYIATPLARAVLADKGVAYEDTQITLIDEPKVQRHTGMDHLL